MGNATARDQAARHELQDAKRSLGALLETIERLEADSGDSPAPDQEELERRIQELEAERDFYKDKYEQSVTPLMKPRPASPKSGSLDERYRMKRETRTASVEIRTFENHIKNANSPLSAATRLASLDENATLSPSSSVPMIQLGQAMQQQQQQSQQLEQAQQQQQQRQKQQQLQQTSDGTPARLSKARFRLLRANDEECVYESCENIETQVLSQNLVRLVWVDRPTTILLIKKPGDPEATKALMDLACFLHNHMHLTVYVEPTVIVEEEVSQLSKILLTWRPEQLQHLNQIIDVIACMGGDGTLLWVSSLFKSAVPPVISFAMGSLGFLTPFKFEDHRTSLQNIVRVGCNLTLRGRLVCRIVRRSNRDRSGQATPVPTGKSLKPSLSSVHITSSWELGDPNGYATKCVPAGSSHTSSHVTSSHDAKDSNQYLPSPKSAGSVKDNAALRSNSSPAVPVAAGSSAVSSSAVAASVGGVSSSPNSNHSSKTAPEDHSPVAFGVAHKPDSAALPIARSESNMSANGLKPSLSAASLTVPPSVAAQVPQSSRASEDVDVTYMCLNEVVVDRGQESALTNLDCYCDNVYFTKVQADGIIIATPTGSTAYSLSAGGSMVHPEVPAICFTPICPHSLSFRPLLFPDSSTLRIVVSKDSRGPASVCFDGRNRQILSKGDYVEIKMSPHPIPAICAADETSDWFTSVRSILQWNVRTNQKGAAKRQKPNAFGTPQ